MNTFFRDDHLSSKPHGWKEAQSSYLAELKAAFGVESSELWRCAVCDKEFGVFHKDDHLRGKKHVKALRERADDPEVDGEIGIRGGTQPEPSGLNYVECFSSYNQVPQQHPSTPQSSLYIHEPSPRYPSGISPHPSPPISRYTPSPTPRYTLSSRSPYNPEPAPQHEPGPSSRYTPKQYNSECVSRYTPALIPQYNQEFIFRYTTESIIPSNPGSTSIYAPELTPQPSHQPQPQRISTDNTKDLLSDFDIETFHCSMCSVAISVAAIKGHLTSSPIWRCPQCHSFIHTDWQIQHLENCIKSAGEAEGDFFVVGGSQPVAVRGEGDKSSDVEGIDPLWNDDAEVFTEWRVMKPEQPGFIISRDGGGGIQAEYSQNSGAHGLGCGSELVGSRSLPPATEGSPWPISQTLWEGGVQGPKTLLEDSSDPSIWESLKYFQNSDTEDYESQVEDGIQPSTPPGDPPFASAWKSPKYIPQPNTEDRKPRQEIEIRSSEPSTNKCRSPIHDIPSWCCEICFKIVPLGAKDSHLNDHKYVQKKMLLNTFLGQGTGSLANELLGTEIGVSSSGVISQQSCTPPVDTISDILTRWNIGPSTQNNIPQRPDVKRTTSGSSNKPVSMHQEHQKSTTLPTESKVTSVSLSVDQVKWTCVVCDRTMYQWQKGLHLAGSSHFKKTQPEVAATRSRKKKEEKELKKGERRKRREERKMGMEMESEKEGEMKQERAEEEISKQQSQPQQESKKATGGNTRWSCDVCEREMQINSRYSHLAGGKHKEQLDLKMNGGVQSISRPEGSGNAYKSTGQKVSPHEESKKREDAQSELERRIQEVINQHEERWRKEDEEKLEEETQERLEEVMRLEETWRLGWGLRKEEERGQVKQRIQEEPRRHDLERQDEPRREEETQKEQQLKCEERQQAEELRALEEKWNAKHDHVQTLGQTTTNEETSSSPRWRCDTCQRTMHAASRKPHLQGRMHLIKANRQNKIKLQGTARPKAIFIEEEPRIEKWIKEAR